MRRSTIDINSLRDYDRWDDKAQLLCDLFDDEKRNEAEGIALVMLEEPGIPAYHATIVRCILALTSNDVPKTSAYYKALLDVSMQVSLRFTTPSNISAYDNAFLSHLQRILDQTVAVLKNELSQREGEEARYPRGLAGGIPSPLCLASVLARKKTPPGPTEREKEAHRVRKAIQHIKIGQIVRKRDFQ